MNKNIKIIGLLLVIIALIIGIVYYINHSKENDTNQNKTKNTNEIIEQTQSKISELKTIQDYEIFNAHISVEREITNFKAYIRNTSMQTKQNKDFKIEILGEKQEVLGTIIVHVNQLEPNEIAEINGDLWKGIQNAKDYRVIEK